ncbi:MAG TPA: DUF1360 domain-containing protein, partial [Gammaproteobacteria bacterium]|nr:DUF1360 domain-containing protein [Gammaproteobacteria bacterium]
MSLLALIVLILASFRITRIFVDDTITEPYRMWFVRWHEKTHSKASHFFLTLITCPWCLGWWVSGSATLVYFLGVEDWPGLLEFL